MLMYAAIRSYYHPGEHGAELLQESLEASSDALQTLLETHTFRKPAKHGAGTAASASETGRGSGRRPRGGAARSAGAGAASIGGGDADDGLAAEFVLPETVVSRIQFLMTNVDAILDQFTVGMSQNFFLPSSNPTEG